MQFIVLRLLAHGHWHQSDSQSNSRSSDGQLL